MNETQKEIKGIWEEQLLSIIDTSNKNISEMDSLMKIVALMLHERCSDELVTLYNIVNDVDKFAKIVNAFSNMWIKIPNRDEFKYCYQIALAFYYRKIKGMSWEEVKAEFPMENNIGLKSGKGVACLDRNIQEELEKLFESEAFNEQRT